MNEENKKRFLSHARIQSPREACGLIVVEDGKEKLVICKNKAEFDHQFIIDPEDYFLASENGEIVGVVHSHPMGSAWPSEADVVSCEQTKLVWHIVSCLDGEWVVLRPKGYKAPLVGRNWCHGILDCYSLVRDYFLEELKIVLPDYEREFEWWLNGKNLYLDNFSNAGFVDVPIESLRKNDVILMQLQSIVPNHAAVYLGNEMILHHLHKRLSSRDVFGGYWLKNTVKVLRHRSLLDEKS